MKRKCPECWVPRALWQETLRDMWSCIACGREFKGEVIAVREVRLPEFPGWRGLLAR